MKIQLIIVAFACIVAGCSTQQPAATLRTVTGVLNYYPSNVKSSEAWYGHNFIVNGMPIISTENVSEGTLKKHAGSRVTITGIWQPGKRWKPSTQELLEQMPIDPDKDVVIIGDGLKALSIVKTER
jgi:hypothetical protein